MSAVPLAAAGKTHKSPGFPVRLTLADENRDLQQLQKLGIDVDGVFRGWARIYVTQEELEALTALGFTLERLPHTAPEMARRVVTRKPSSAQKGGVPSVFHTYATLTAELQQIAADHADIVRLSSVGQSVQGRELWMVLISKDPDVESDEPEFAYISSMHGDEVVGKEMCVNLINHLTDNYGTDPRVTDLVDSTEIWIMPSMNPDGTEAGQRWNANGVDLNRDFPDQFSDPINSPKGRQVETQHVMNWGALHATVLGANMHGGALVANYPFDSNPSNAPVFSPTPDPDHGTYVSIARTYADNNPPMSVSNSHPAFDNGITNGADWFTILGGMQDWNYVWRGNFELTLELSVTKWPAGSTLPGFWADNQESLLAYIEQLHEGLRGLVTDSITGAPVAAEIRINANPHPARTDSDVGDYYRLLLPGSYAVQVTATGYEPQTIQNVVIAAGPATRLDISMVPLAVNLVLDGACADNGFQCDAWLDVATSSDLAVTLRNLGASATTVSASIEPTSWYADVSRADAQYPDLPTASAGQSLAPHHGVGVSPDVPVGHKLGFAVNWRSDQGSGVAGPFFMEVGAATCTTILATDVPQPVSDFVTTLSSLSVGSNVELDGLKVTVDISHTFIGDLKVDLTAPDSSNVVLHDRSGGSADDIVGTYGGDLTPVGDLGQLDSMPTGGSWELRVTDNAGGDTGTLNGWSIEACGRGFEVATPEMRLRSLSLDQGQVQLEWWPYPGLQSYRVYRATDAPSAAAFADVTVQDGDDTDTSFTDSSAAPLVFYLVTGVGPLGEGPKGHFGE